MILGDDFPSLTEYYKSFTKNLPRPDNFKVARKQKNF